MKDLHTLRKYSMKPFFNKKPFITQRDFENNYADIMIITGALRRLKHQD